MSPEESKRLEALVRECADNLFEYAKACVHDPDLARELVADVFHEAAEGAEKVVAHPNPGGWLKLTLKNKIKQRWRDQRRDASRLLEFNEEDLLPGWSDRPTEEAVERELSDLADTQAKIKAALSDVQYYVIKRITLENATHKAVAQELGISVWNSQKILERARKTLGKLFPDHAKRKKKK